MSTLQNDRLQEYAYDNFIALCQDNKLIDFLVCDNIDHHHQWYNKYYGEYPDEAYDEIFNRIWEFDATLSVTDIHEATVNYFDRSKDESNI